MFFLILIFFIVKGKPFERMGHLLKVFDRSPPKAEAKLKGLILKLYEIRQPVANIRSIVKLISRFYLFFAQFGLVIIPERE